jgi:Glycosyltransferase family 9 (heptosyltransferase)
MIHIIFPIFFEYNEYDIIMRLFFKEIDMNDLNVDLSQSKIRVIDKNELLDPNANFLLKSMLIPGFYQKICEQRGTKKNILIKSWGGLGDQICGEPTIRYAIENFKDCEISLAAREPCLYQHLKFKKVYYLLNNEIPNEKDYNMYDIICSDDQLKWEFICHLFINCVDFASICAFRCQLPLSYKHIKLVPNHQQNKKIDEIIDSELKNKKYVVLHAGSSWQSKTFPQYFYNEVIKTLIKNNIIPVLIGAEYDIGGSVRTTINGLNTNGCVDLRGKLEIMETIALLQKCRVLLTNDSAPLHMAASGNAWIGFITFVKHPDYLFHTRNKILGWRMRSFEKDIIWNHRYILEDIQLEKIEEDFIIKNLPSPEEFAQWAIHKS